ncbi:Tyrosinase-like protein 1 [Mizuhopecten yessoensis]|uniref:Tyrosinase-like protein 1 n=1 Tax=Mizuhopecten yessoensis TaxID=6573 RepID=A0A210R253_MIZYE|nr:Tyrosinase-like protein 1 [Mizuhopecten yessoensis]
MSTLFFFQAIRLFGLALVAGWITYSHAFVEPIPMPENLVECYEFRTHNISITEIPSQDINMFCITQFLYSTTDLRPQRPIANETILYAQELFRRLVNKHEHHRRTKRQFNPMVRREIRTLSRDEWNTFTARLNELKQRPVGDIYGYDALADIHRLVENSAHNGPNFLGWHRIYLALLEIALGVPVPYWDSSLDYYMDQPTDSIVWTAEFFGNGFGAVEEGPFQWMTPEGVPLVRNIGNDGTLINSDVIAAVLSRRFHRQIVEPSQNPRFSLEVHHNGPHVWMDGQMSAPATAAQDPVFFMHHAFIDYIWSLFRSLQRANGINPEEDYPRTRVRMHQPWDRMIPFGLRNFHGYSNFFESLNVYDPSPRCPDCGGNPYLECGGDRCRSRVALSPSRPSEFGFVGGVPSSFGGQARSQATLQRTGALPIGRRFQAFFRDPRVRGDTMPNAPSNRIRRSVSDNKENVTKDNKDSAQISKPYQNTFVLNGVSNVDLWVFIPVRIIFERPPEIQFESYLIQNGTLVKSSDMFSPAEFKGLKVEIKRKMPATYKKCHVSGSGASKVYVQTDGIDYSGRYKDYAVVDERLPFSSSMTYIGAKNPTEGASQFYMTAYDSCGRVCRPQCLINGIYRPCSGAFRISTSLPKMYGITYEDAVKGIWKKGQGLLSEANASEIPVTFLCEIQSTWPWSP